jgi:hypothetical protein
MFVLPAGQTRTVTARIDHMGAGGVSNTNTSVHMDLIALAAQ